MSAAIQIKAPPPDSPSHSAAAEAGSKPAAAGAQPGLKMCRNELIHGSCKYEDDGCLFYHPSKHAQTSQAQSTPTSPSASSATPRPLPSFSVQAVVNAPSFVPRALSAAVPAFATAAAAAPDGAAEDGPSSTKSTPVLSALSPAFTLAGPSSPSRTPAELQPANGLSEAYTKLSLSAAPFAPSGGSSRQSASDANDVQTLDDAGEVGHEHVYADPAAGFYAEMGAVARQPLDYHLYVTPLPHVASYYNPPSSSSSSSSQNIHTFFLAPHTHQHLTARAHAALETLPVGVGPPLPRTLHVYHSLHPLEAPGPSSSSSASEAGGVFAGLRTEAYRAASTADGRLYCLRRVEGFKILDEGAFATIEGWRRIVHPGVVGVKEAFTTRAFGDSSVVLAFDYHPLSHTLHAEHFVARPPTTGRNGRLQPHDMHVPERVLWSYAVQLAGALRRVHREGLAARVVDAGKILVTGKNRIRLNCCALLDVVTHNSSASPNLAAQQSDDLVALGKLLLNLSNVSPLAVQNIPKALDVLARSYSAELRDFVLFLLAPAGPGARPKTADEVLRLLGPHVLDELESATAACDVWESEVGKELENGRLVRLLVKFGFINERPEFDHDPRWSESGDRYILKLFRDLVFHQVDETGAPVLDLSHVLTCLNKLDAGTDEKVLLMSRDEQSCLVVSYRDLKACTEGAYADLSRGTST